MAEWGGAMGGDGRLIGWMSEAAEHAEQREREVAEQRAGSLSCHIAIRLTRHGITTDGKLRGGMLEEVVFWTELHLLKWDEIYVDAAVPGGNPLLYAIDQVAKELIDG